LKAGIRPGPAGKCIRDGARAHRYQGRRICFGRGLPQCHDRHDAHDADDDDSGCEHASGNKAQCEALVLPLDH